jgi:hypothetical protein
MKTETIAVLSGIYAPDGIVPGLYPPPGIMPYLGGFASNTAAWAVDQLHVGRTNNLEMAAEAWKAKGNAARLGILAQQQKNSSMWKLANEMEWEASRILKVAASREADNGKLRGDLYGMIPESVYAQLEPDVQRWLVEPAGLPIPSPVPPKFPVDTEGLGFAVAALLPLAYIAIGGTLITLILKYVAQTVDSLAYTKNFNARNASVVAAAEASIKAGTDPVTAYKEAGKVFPAPNVPKADKPFPTKTVLFGIGVVTIGVLAGPWAYRKFFKKGASA